MEEQILVQSDNNYEFVKFAASPMGHGHVLNLNKWIYKVDGIVLNKTSCAFAVWEMDTWDSFVIVQECVVLMVVKKSITDCFIKFEVFCQVVTVGEWKVKRRKSHHQLINRMTLLMKVVMVTGGVKRSKGSTEEPFK